MYSDRSSQYSIAGFLAVLLVALAIVAPRFFDLRNLGDLGTTTAIAAIVGLGALFVIVTGNIDVSAGAIYGTSAVIAALVAKAGLPTPVVVLVAVASGALLGLINALLVTVLRLPSIIATLGTSSLYTGALIAITGGGLWVVGLPDGFTWLGQGAVVGLSVPIIIALVVLGLAAFVLARTPFGRRFYAVGSNAEAARLSGINSRAVEGSAFVLNGALLALAATLTAARLGQAQNNIGASITIAAITIAVVAGTSVFGGTGSVLGIVLAAILVQTTTSALTFFRLDPLWAQMVQGLLILAALVLSVIQRRRAGLGLVPRFLRGRGVSDAV